MKKQYMQPTAAKVAVKEALMHTGSFSNTKGHLQTGVEANDKDDFEAGSKDHQTNLWGKWDE